MTRPLRTALVLLVGLLPLALAQSVYIGGASGLPLGINPSMHLGIGLPANFELRAGVTASPGLSGLNIASADALYSIALPSSRLYLGAGADAFLGGELPGTLAEARRLPFGAHAVGGGELRYGALGLFGEVQPGLQLPTLSYYFRTRLGVNLHF
jgi:hypothetical protein